MLVVSYRNSEHLVDSTTGEHAIRGKLHVVTFVWYIYMSGEITDANKRSKIALVSLNSISYLQQSPVICYCVWLLTGDM